jgi:hypothetical protein
MLHPGPDGLYEAQSHDKGEAPVFFFFYLLLGMMLCPCS